MKRTHLLPLLIFAAILALALGTGFAFLSKGQKQPKIIWEPQSVTATISPGESKTIQVTFTSSEDVGDVVVRVVPELKPFVQVEPASFEEIEEGQTVNLSITFSAAQDASLGTFKGTIQLREDDEDDDDGDDKDDDPKKSRTFAKPLPVVVNVWQRFSDPRGQYSLLFPPDLLLKEIPAESLAALSLISAELEPGDIGYPGPIQLKLYENPNNLAVAAFFNGDIAPDLFSGSSEVVEILVDNRPAILFRGVQGLISSDVVVVPLATGFLEVTRLETSQVAQFPLELILNNLSFP